jgi:hypothetical protein
MFNQAREGKPEAYQSETEVAAEALRRGPLSGEYSLIAIILDNETSPRGDKTEGRGGKPCPFGALSKKSISFIDQALS